MIYASHSMASVLLISACLGFVLGIFYDVLRFLRELISPGRLRVWPAAVRIADFSLTFVFDIFFFAVSGIAMSFALYYANDGIFRASALVVAILGFCLYKATFGRIIYALLKFLQKMLKKIVKISLKTIAFPIKSVYNIVARVSEHFSLPKSGSIFEKHSEKGGDRSEQ